MRCNSLSYSTKLRLLFDTIASAVTSVESRCPDLHLSVHVNSKIKRDPHRTALRAITNEIDFQAKIAPMGMSFEMVHHQNFAS